MSETARPMITASNYVAADPLHKRAMAVNAALELLRASATTDRALLNMGEVLDGLSDMANKIQDALNTTR